jgi:hypothetical protein
MTALGDALMPASFSFGDSDAEVKLVLVRDVLIRAASVHCICADVYRQILQRVLLETLLV